MAMQSEEAAIASRAHAGTCTVELQALLSSWSLLAQKTLFAELGVEDTLDVSWHVLDEDIEKMQMPAHAKGQALKMLKSLRMQDTQAAAYLGVTLDAWRRSRRKYLRKLRMEELSAQAGGAAHVAGAAASQRRKNYD